MINWKAAGRGPRLADFAYLIWGTGLWNPRRPNPESINAAVDAYRRHVEPTQDELERLEAVMYLRTIYLVLRLPTCRDRRREIRRVGLHTATRVLHCHGNGNSSRIPTLNRRWDKKEQWLCAAGLVRVRARL